MMLSHALSSLEAYVLYYSQIELPVLKGTVRSLAQLREKEDTVNGREIAAIVLQDPLMTLKVLAYLEQHRGKRQNNDITTIGHAIMMLGITPFFEKFSDMPLVEDQLKAYPKALLGVLRVIARSRSAARYARDWAAIRHDMDVDEITVATLLHECTEILSWVFAPEMALKVRELVTTHKGMRTAAAQMQVFGCTAHELQLGLAKAWKLPDLLVSLMSAKDHENPRLKTVQLALNLARHAQNGWDDPALPDDYTAISELLHMSHENVLLRIGAPLPSAVEEAEDAGGADDSVTPPAA